MLCVQNSLGWYPIAVDSAKFNITVTVSGNVCGSIYSVSEYSHVLFPFPASTRTHINLSITTHSAYNYTTATAAQNAVNT